MKIKIIDKDGNIIEIEIGDQTFPTFPAWPNFTPWELGNKCPKCGLKLEGAMSYYCGTPNCPTGLGGPSSYTCSSISIKE